MSYVLYSSIARAGGLDLLLSLESYTRKPGHPLLRQSGGQSGSRAGSCGRLARLRRRSGRALIGLGEALSGWGRRWAAPAGATGLRVVMK